MAKFDINTKQDILDLFNNEDTPLAEGDIIVHKPFEIYILEPEMKKIFGNSLELFAATVGTDIYADYGYNTSMVSRLD